MCGAGRAAFPARHRKHEPAQALRAGNQLNYRSAQRKIKFYTGFILTQNQFLATSLTL